MRLGVRLGVGPRQNFGEKSLLLLLLFIMVVLMTSRMIHGGSGTRSAEGQDPLAPFARLVGGEWHVDQTYQSFEWDMDRRSIISRGYALAKSKTHLVSELKTFDAKGAEAIHREEWQFEGDDR